MKVSRGRIISIVVVACLCMAVVDAVIQPGYVPKSATKLVLFLLLPIFCAFYDRQLDLKSIFVPGKKGLTFAVAVGALLYVFIVAAYLIFKNVFDFSGITGSVTSSTGVRQDNFLWVALYICLVNSLLEEFFFRGFAFLALKQFCSRRFCYIFSAMAFALYHVSMMLGWFAWPVLLLSIAGLFVGGLIFNFFNEKYRSIYPSYLIHFFANLATNTIGFLLFQQ